jgi:Amt family ammonium transporter
VRSKNMLSVLAQVFVIFSLITVLWAIYGYAGLRRRRHGGFDKLFSGGITPDTLSSAEDHPEYVFVAFQSTFAAITVALIVGRFAERIKFAAVMLFSVLWFTFSYIPMAHGVGRWSAGCGRRAGLRRRHRGAHQRRHRRPGRLHGGQAHRLRP